MLGHGIVLALVTGVVTATAAAGIQAARAVSIVQSQGVTVSMPALGPVTIHPPSGGGKTLTLPAQASRMVDDLPMVAGIAGFVAVVFVLVLTPRGGK